MTGTTHVSFLRALALVGTLVVTACGGAATPPSEPAPTGGVAQTSTPTAREKLTIRLAHQQPATHPNHKQLELFASEVKQRSNGEIEVQLFPAGQLYAEKDAIAAVQRGEVQMVMVTNSFWETVVPAISVLDLPFRFDTWESYHRNVDGRVGELLSEEMEKKGVRPLAWIDNSAVDLIGTRETQVKTVADLKGLRLRSFSDAVSQMITDWGAAPTNMSATEVYTGLQRGTIDGLISGRSFFERKWYEVAPYLTYVPVQFAALLVGVNAGFWKDLPADQQKVITDAMQAAKTLNREETPKQNAAAYEELEKLAKGWHEVPAAEMKKWQESVPSMDAWYLDRAGDLGRQILAAIK